MKTIIVPNNGALKVDCYGTFKWDSNVECCFDDEIFDDIFDGGIDCTEENLPSHDLWQLFVDRVAVWAAQRDTFLVQCEAC